ncbi:MAG: MlaD family protein [Bacteroidota bacterium]
MGRISNELKIGLTVLAAIVVVWIGFRVMRDEPWFGATNVIYTRFERVDGLLPGNFVTLNGFKIGSVKELSLLPSDSTEVSLTITEPIPIPKGSKAVLKLPGPIGAASIEIIKSSSNETINWGDRLPGELDGGLLGEITDKGTGLVDTVAVIMEGFNLLLNNVNGLIQGQAGENIQQTIGNVEQLTDGLNEVLDEQQQEIDSIMTSAKDLMNTLAGLSDENREELDTVIKNLEKTSGALTEMTSDLTQTTDEINRLLSQINKGEGSMGKLLYDESLYQNLDSLTFNLNLLIKNINENPKRYLKHMRLVDVF